VVRIDSFIDARFTTDCPFQLTHEETIECIRSLGRRQTPGGIGSRAGDLPLITHGDLLALWL